MKHVLSLLTTLALVSQGWAVDLKVPDSVKGDVGDFIKVPATTTGVVVRWVALDRGLAVFPVELLKDSKTAIVIAKTAGSYRVLAYTSDKDGPSDPAVCTVIVGDIPPVPPGPNPPVPPVPPTPVGDNRCLIVYESAELPRMPEKQQQILASNVVRSYLRGHTVKEPDATKNSWGIFDKDADLTGYSKELQAMMSRPRKEVPWVVITSQKGLYEGPLPGSVDEFLTLAKKYLGD